MKPQQQDLLEAHAIQAHSITIWQSRLLSSVLGFDAVDSHNKTNNVLKSVDLNIWEAIASNTRRRF